MSFKNLLKSDLDVFLNEDEFAQEVYYFLGSSSTKVTVQFFDEESDLGDSMMRKLICRITDLPNISKENSYFLINTVKYGILDFNPDEENVMLYVLLQKGM